MRQALSSYDIPLSALICREDRDEEFSNQRGAERLKQMIEDYWAERGETIDVRIVAKGFVQAMRGRRYDVRSDLVDGLPQRRK